jgi:hypothetical protein
MYMADIQYEMADTYQTQIIKWLTHKKWMPQEKWLIYKKWLRHKMTIEK